MADFLRVGSASEVKNGEMKGFSIGKEKILVTNLDGKFYALSSVCTHKGGPLEKGTLGKNIVTCPWHHSEFDVTTGGVIKGPATNPLKKFEVKVVGEDLLVRI